MAVYKDYNNAVSEKQKVFTKALYEVASNPILLAQARVIRIVRHLSMRRIRKAKEWY